MASASPSIDPTAPPILSEDNVFTLNVMPGLTIPAAQTSIAGGGEPGSGHRWPPSRTPIPSTNPAVIADARQAMVDLTRLIGASFLAASDKQTEQLAAESGVTAYFDRPRLILVSSPPQLVDGSIAEDRSTCRSTSATTPSEPSRAPARMRRRAFAFNFARGLAEERAGIGDPPEPDAGGQAAAGQHADGLPGRHGREHRRSATSGRATSSLLDTLNISANAKAQITAAVQAGNVVFLPLGNVRVGGITTIGLVPDRSQHRRDDRRHRGRRAPVPCRVCRHLRGRVVPRSTTVLVGPIELFLKNHPSILRPGEEFRHAKPAQARSTPGALIVGLLLAFEIADPPLAHRWSRSSGAGGSLLFIDGAIDPPVSPLLSSLENFEAPARNTATGIVPAAAGQAAGPVQADGPVQGAAVSGTLDASWASTSETSFQAQTIAATGAAITNATGQVVGTGAVALVASPRPSRWPSRATIKCESTERAASRSTAPPEQPGRQRQLAELHGDRHRQRLDHAHDRRSDAQRPGPPRRHLHDHDRSATLTGSGATSSPNFAGSASITASGGTVNLGPGTGSALRRRHSRSIPTNETTLDGYTGTITVSANGDGTDTVALERNGGQRAPGRRPAPPTFTTDQNTPVTFQTNVKTSFADTYKLTVKAPPGWTVSIDASGNVTADARAGAPERHVSRSRSSRSRRPTPTSTPRPSST